MSRIYVIVLLCCTCLRKSNSSTTTKRTTTTKPQFTEEDLRIINESIAKYGPVRVHDFEELGLPGPEIVTSIEAKRFKNIHEFDDESGNYTIKIRGLTELFAYNRRYEVGTKAKFGEDPIVKGQFTEHFKSQDAIYIRTIGYILDEDGYREFLLDISKTEDVLIGIRISSAAIGSLIGGGLG